MTELTLFSSTFVLVLDSISKGGIFAGMTPQNLILNGQDLDKAIDLARAKEAT